MAAAKSTATKRVEAFVRSQTFTVARSNQRGGFATSGARIKGMAKAGMFDRLIYARFRGSVMSEETIESVKKINKGVESANRGFPILNFPSPSTSSIMRKQNLCRRG